MLGRLRERAEWKFFGVLPRANRGLAFAWWAVLLLPVKKDMRISSGNCSADCEMGIEVRA